MRGCGENVKYLIVQQWVPMPDRNSGDLRLFEIVKILRGERHDVTFFSVTCADPRYRRMLQELGVEVALDASGVFGNWKHFTEFLMPRKFDAAILVRYQAFNAYDGPLRQVLPGCALILDTVDLHHLRLMREAVLFGGEERRKAAGECREAELRAVRYADAVWVVTDKEREALSGVAARVDVVSNIHRAAADVTPYEGRSGIVYLGGYDYPPNADAARFFMSDIYPLLSLSLGPVPMTFAGVAPPDDLKAFTREHAEANVPGFVDDHRALLMRHRVGMAPLRFGAGMKGKICEYLACGLPCVTTPIGAEGMKLVHGVNVLVADSPEQFVAELSRVYQNAELWRSLSAAGIAYIRGNMDTEVVRETVLASLAETARSRRWKSSPVGRICKLMMRRARHLLGRNR
jgi:glycosyltransferase involved in cell wall biosynthesis